MRVALLAVALLLLSGCVSAVDLTNMAARADRRGRHDQVVANARRATEINPRYAAAWYWLGAGHHARGEYREAITAFRRFFELRPANAVHVRSAYGLLGNAYLQTQQLELAAQNLRRAAQLDPSNVFVHNRLGLAQLRLRQYEAAALSFKRAIELNPRAGVFHFNLSTVYAAQQKYDLALAALERAQQLGYNVPQNVMSRTKNLAAPIVEPLRRSEPPALEPVTVPPLSSTEPVTVPPLPSAEAATVAPVPSSEAAATAPSDEPVTVDPLPSSEPPTATPSSR